MKYILLGMLALGFTKIFAQNVGIGITTPDEKLHVDSVIRIGKNAIIAAGSTRKNTIKFGDGNFATIGEQDKDDRLVLNAGSFSFKTGNVGIGVDSAKDKLDVVGNANFTGQLKLNSNAGLASQVLMKDASNNPVWGDISDFKEILMYDCNATNSNGSNADNCNFTFTIPTGITKILVECWGGGGAGGYAAGGGAGGYISAKINVTAGTIASLSVGASGFVSFFGAAIDGATTSFTLNGATLTAFGGKGGSKYNILAAGSYDVANSNGGGFQATGVGNNFFGIDGGNSGISKLSFMQTSATEFARTVQFGDGGETPFSNGLINNGGYSIFLANGDIKLTRAKSPPPAQGGGGAADGFGGSIGRGGRIIIRY